MKRRGRLPAVIAALLAGASCGYPSFVFNGSGAGAATGGGGASSSSTTSSHGSTTSSSGDGGGTSTSSSTTSSSTSSTSSSGADCTLDHLVISQILSRGQDGATDEFVELFNPTSEDVALDSTWTLDGRSVSSLTYSNRWTGYGGDTIPAYGHFLITGTGYSGSVPADDMLGDSITDEESVVLNQNGNAVDAVCYYTTGDATALIALQTAVLFFTCSGTPVANPHDNETDTDTDQSLDRRPGGAAGNCTDTDDNASDFVILSPSAPEDSASPPTPG